MINIMQSYNRFIVAPFDKVSLLLSIFIVAFSTDWKVRVPASWVIKQSLGSFNGMTSISYIIIRVIQIYCCYHEISLPIKTCPRDYS